jgi:uncharacterized protein (TIGR02996 family)
VDREETFLQAIRQSPGDAATRLVYADWLEDNGHAERAELVHVAESMREMAVFTDDYWHLKSRRNELRKQCPPDWLAATGYDGSRYDPVLRHGLPDDWKGRWRLVREFTERWYGIHLGDVGGRQEEIRAEEERLGRPLPPSVREYVAYALDLDPLMDVGIVYYDLHLQPVDGHPALSIMRERSMAHSSVLGLPLWQSSLWAVPDEDLGVDDPAVRCYKLEFGATRYEPAGPAEERIVLSDLVTRQVMDVELLDHERAGGKCLSKVVRVGELKGRLEAAFPYRLNWHSPPVYEGEGFFVRLFLYEDHTRHPPDLVIWLRPGNSWEQVPAFIWDYVRWNEIFFFPEEGSPTYEKDWAMFARLTREWRQKNPGLMRRGLNAVQRWLGPGLSRSSGTD